MIDAVPSGPKNYPVEVLHRIKSEHELWVEETLAPKADVSSLVYARVIDDISTVLLLNRWVWFVDNAVRNILPMEVSETLEYLRQRVLQIIWPGKHPRLEAAAKATMDSFIRFVDHFESFCEPTYGGTALQANVSWKRIHPNPNYVYWASRRNIWSHLNNAYLCDTVLHLNDFAEQVRATTNPGYFAAQGRFLMHDSMGYRGRGAAFLPDRVEVNEWLTSWKKIGNARGAARIAAASLRVSRLERRRDVGGLDALICCGAWPLLANAGSVRAQARSTPAS
ncbi:hypothetical protein [Chondromyces apiculatus]|uniref:hypothetical protein n=1 Tax=Chondromyces apiculatus TaxID=51 RepID=UPI0005C475A3|nr:hypothetical protein [Chondromyces apiculatus]